MSSTSMSTTAAEEVLKKFFLLYFVAGKEKHNIVKIQSKLGFANKVNPYLIENKTRKTSVKIVHFECGASNTLQKS